MSIWESCAHIGTSNGYQINSYQVHIGKFINDLFGMMVSLDFYNRAVLFCSPRTASM